jgi:hypothetical protein
LQRQVLRLWVLAALAAAAPGWALSPRQAAMQMAMGGWGDSGEAAIVDQPTAGGPYSLRVAWKDDLTTDFRMWVLGWGVRAQGYERLSFDLFVASSNGKAGMAVYLTEADGDRWVAPVDVAKLPLGAWHRFDFGRDELRLWGLGNDQRNWETISAFGLEPNGEGGELTCYLDNIILAGPTGHANLLDPDLLPTPYPRPDGPAAPLNAAGPAGTAYLAGSAGGFTQEPKASLVEKLAALSPSIGFSASGFGSPAGMARLSERTRGLGRALVQEDSVGGSFAVEITAAGAWGTRFDGAGNNTTPGQFNVMHTATVCHPAVLALHQRRADACLAAGINTLVFFDYVWPYWGGRWGYGEAEVAAYRKALAGTDGGLRVAAAGGERDIAFWDYFADYSGYLMQPADLGLERWEDYVPVTEAQAWADEGVKRRNLFLLVTLNHWEWLKFLNDLGLYLRSRGGALWIIPNPEDLGDAADFVYAARLVGLQGNFPEYFGNPLWTEALYRSGPYLSGNCRAAGTFIGPQLETGVGGHGVPYYDAEVSYATTYDLCAALEADVIKNDFIDETPFAVLTDRAHPQFDRFRDCLGKVYAFDQFRLDQARRPASAVAVITPRNINRYRGDLFYGFGATASSYDGCLAEAMAREGLRFDFMDALAWAPIEAHRTVFWNYPEAPLAAVERIRQWLAGDASRVLVCHSYQPTRRMRGLHYNPWNWAQDVVEDPDGGAAWGLPRISKLPFAGGAVTGALAPLDTAFTVGERLTLPAERYEAAGGRALLEVDGKALVSEFGGPGGSRVLYLHYRAGEPGTVDLDRRLLRALAAALGAERLAASVDAALVHSYRIAEGSVHVVWNRQALEGWDFVYDGNRRQRLRFQQPGVTVSARVPVPSGGEYLVYEALRDQSQVIVTQESVELPLAEVACGVYYLLRNDEPGRAKLDQVRAAKGVRFLADTATSAP